MKGNFYIGKDRFEDKTMPIPETGCWIWMASTKGKTGYGKFTTDGDHKNISAHRYSYIRYKGAIPSGMCVCHSCDIRLCVNPDHLFLGTHQDNVDDMVQKGRTKNAVGEDNHSKLTTEDVINIRIEYEDIRTSHRDLGKKYNISHSTVGNIIRRKKWKHII